MPTVVHITKGGGNAKYWLLPDCKEDYSYEFTVAQRRDIKALVNKHREQLIKKWNGYFKK